MAIKQGKIITITSVKGGTGKTNITLNIAGIMSNQKKKVIIVDLDLYSGVIASSLNIKPKKDIYDLVDDFTNNRFTSFEDYITSYNEYIDILPSPKDPRCSGKINPSSIDVILKRLKMKYDTILIDTNHIIDKINLVILDETNIVLYVITADLMDIKNMKTMLSIFKDMDMKKYKIILNEAIGNKSSCKSYDVNNILNENIDYIIPPSFHNTKQEKYTYEGKITTMDKNINKTKGAEVLQKIIKDIIE